MRVGRVEGDGWMAKAKDYCIERLNTYWLPRVSATNNVSSALPPVKMWEELESHDSSLPFVNGLCCNALAGHPFQYYLNRSVN